MMTKLQKNILVFIMFFALNFTANAQFDPGDPGNDPGDTPAAAIDDYVPLMLLSALSFGYFLVRKRKSNEI